MERLAKEKISAQNKMVILKREMGPWDLDISKLPTDNDLIQMKILGNLEKGKLDDINKFTFLISSIFFIYQNK